MSIRVRCGLPLVGLCILMIGCGGDRVGELIAQLKHPDVEIRRAAVRTLSGQTGTDDRVVSALSSAVADSDAEVRWLSAQALGAIGPPAKSSLRALKTALEDLQTPVRRSAALAIQRIDPQERSFVPVLVAAMRDGDGRTTVAVGAMGADAAWAVPTLIGLLSHDLPQVRALAAQTLGRIGPPAGDAKPALQRALRDPNVAVQSAAQRALDRIQAPSASEIR